MSNEIKTFEEIDGDAMPSYTGVNAPKMPEDEPDKDAMEDLVDDETIPALYRDSNEPGVLAARAAEMAAIARGRESASGSTTSGPEERVYEPPEDPHSSLGGGVPSHRERSKEYIDATSRTEGVNGAGTAPTIDTPEPEKDSPTGSRRPTIAEQNANERQFIREQRRLYPKDR